MIYVVIVIVHPVRKKIEEVREKKKEKKMLNNYYGGMRIEIAMDLVLRKKQMVFSNQMIKKAVFLEDIGMNPI